jgi:hypothetical protein
LGSGRRVDRLRRLLETGLEYLVDLDESAEGFEQRLREQWSEGLDLYAAVVVIVEGAGRASIARHAQNMQAHGGEADLLYDVLAQLDGHAVRVAREVYTLLKASFPLGALALSRTLYEVAVRASVLSGHGRSLGHEDLAERAFCTTASSTSRRPWSTNVTPRPWAWSRSRTATPTSCAPSTRTS